MNQTMKAAVVHAFGQPLRIEEVKVPLPGPGQILVKIEACGVCHTDLHAAEGDWPVKPSLPFIPGHEGVGYVAAVGSGVKRVKEGDRVGVPWLYTACGCCEHCLTGWETLCESQQNTGYSINGGYAEYVLADPNYVGILPKNVDFLEIAPILCAGVTVYKGLKETEVKPGEWVVISGIGGLGHMAVQYAKAMGMHVVAADIHEDHAAAHFAGEAHFVGHAHHGHAFVGQVHHHVQHLAHHLGVECGGGFVKQHHDGVHAQGTGNRHALLLAA